MGVENIDYNITSHYHSDTIGCSEAILKDYPLKVAAFDRGGSYRSSAFQKYLASVGSYRRTATQGMTFQLDANSSQPVTIEIVAVNGAGAVTKNENDLSLVTVVRFGDFDFEIGGDISERIETRIADKVGPLEVYFVHHNGSRTSTNSIWLSITQPIVGILSVGENNRYGLPHQEVLDRLHNAGVETYWTEIGNGAVPFSPQWDVIGGDIVIEVEPRSDFFLVRSKKTKKEYLTWEAKSRKPSLSKPVKFAVNSMLQKIAAGDEAKIGIFMQDSRNRLINVLQDYDIEILTQFPSGKIRRQIVTLEESKSEVYVNIPIPEDEIGVVKFQAIHPFLLNGGTAINVNSPQPTPPSIHPLTIRLAVSLEGELLANGVDSATINAYLPDERYAQEDMEIRMSVQGGRMGNLVINQTYNEGKAYLKSEQVGQAVVEYVGSYPIDGDERFMINFVPPIVELNLEPSPPKISLADLAELIMGLFDDEGNLEATDKDRIVELKIDKGGGIFESQTNTIKKNSASVRTRFIPTKLGEVVISAKTTDYRPSIKSIYVTFPYLHLVLVILGGLIGGMIAAKVHKEDLVLRGLMGIVTGLVLYWFFLFVITFPAFRIAISNPISMFVISIIGGFLGTEVFNLVLKVFKLANT